jgi:exopolysaccharide biosynthesis predicted pyruvyltransferase EpsI
MTASTKLSKSSLIKPPVLDNRVNSSGRLPHTIAHQYLRQSILEHPELIAALKHAQQEGACFLPNPGNLGDGLIALGTYDLFDELGWSPDIIKEFKPENLQGTKLVVIGGGGAFIEGLGEEMSRCLRDHLENGGHIILLPSSIYGFEQYFERYAKQVMIFVREKNSAERLAQVAALEGRVHLCPDLAFAIRPDTFSNFSINSRNGTLHAFRTDGESTGIKLPSDNVDIHKLWNGDFWFDREHCLAPLGAVARLIFQFKNVETDRLHMTILSAMLGCHVKMYSNAYYKNKGVYDYSLNLFENVELVANEPNSYRYDMNSDVSNSKILTAFKEDISQAQNNTVSSVWEKLRAELVNHARLRREYFEPEIARLQKLVTDQEKTKHEWFEPELERLNKELKETITRETDDHLPEIARLKKLVAEQEKAKHEWFEPELERLNKELNATQARETNNHLPKTVALQEQLDATRQDLEEARRYQSEGLEPQIAYLKEEVHKLEKRPLLQELQNLRQRIGCHIEQNTYMGRQLAKLQQQFDEAVNLKKEWFEPEIARLSKIVDDYDKTKQDWWDPQLKRQSNIIRDQTVRLKRLEAYETSRIFKIALKYYRLKGLILNFFRRVFKYNPSN